MIIIHLHIGPESRLYGLDYSRLHAILMIWFGSLGLRNRLLPGRFNPLNGRQASSAAYDTNPDGRANRNVSGASKSYNVRMSQLESDLHYFVNTVNVPPVRKGNNAIR